MFAKEQAHKTVLSIMACLFTVVSYSVMFNLVGVANLSSTATIKLASILLTLATLVVDLC